MIKVLLVTSWKERCGIAEYAKYLLNNTPNIDFQILDRPNWTTKEILSRDYDILHVNYEAGLLAWIQPEHIVWVKQRGKKPLITIHTTREGNNRTGFTDQFHRKVVHERTQDGYTYVPMGIPKRFSHISETYLQPTIGTVGFPFGWKNFPQVAAASAILGKGCVVIAPESGHCDTNEIERQVLAAQPSARYFKDWLHYGVVVGMLEQCEVNVFAYAGDNMGVSGAVRLGLAAGRPLVLTRCRQFRDLFDYEDEIEFIPNSSPEEISQGVRRVLDSGKRPKRVLEDMSWNKVGGMYADIYRQMMES